MASPKDPSIVGHIIGPGGANLRHIFDTTGCKIKFVQELTSQITRRAVSGSNVLEADGVSILVSSLEHFSSLAVTCYLQQSQRLRGNFTTKLLYVIVV